jgi:hypothetical protein
VASVKAVVGPVLQSQKEGIESGREREDGASIEKEVPKFTDVTLIPHSPFALLYRY